MTINISIHSLLAEGDDPEGHYMARSKISIHSLLAEGDVKALRCFAHGEISIHSLLAEGDTACISWVPTCSPFQSTPSSRRETPRTAITPAGV